MFAMLRSRLTYANVAATLALFIALGSGSYAAVTVTGKNVKNSSLTGKDIKNNSLTGSDVKSIKSGDVSDHSLLAKDFKAGQLPSGAQGPKGATGPGGPPGSPGVSGLELVTADTSFDSDSSKATFAECPPEKQVISGGYDVTGGKSGASPNETLDIALDRMTPVLDLQHEGIEVGAYEVTGTAQNWSVRAMALCANVSP